MYLLKNISLNHTTKSVVVDPGVQFVRVNHSYIFLNEFWGSTDLLVGEFADFNRLPVIAENKFYLSYVSEYFATKLPDSYTNICFSLSAYEPEKIDGYIVFINSENNISTNGEKLFGRYPTEIVVVLKEGQYLTFSEQKVEVQDGKLKLTL